MKSKMCVLMAIVLMAAIAPVWAEVASDGLVVHYRADNADGAGNPGSGKLATWTDLALEYGEANNGKLNHSISMQQKLKFKFKPGSGWVENTDQPKDSPFRYGLEFKATTHYDGDYVNIKLDLTGHLTEHACRSYESIMGRGLVKTFDEDSDFGGTAYSKPKSVGSYASRFISQVRKGCPGNDKRVPLADFVKLTTWVDANAQYHGSYYGRKNLRFKDHPNFRPVPTFAEAISTVCPVPMQQR